MRYCIYKADSYPSTLILMIGRQDGLKQLTMALLARFSIKH
jgi:hypothetical protein